MNYISDWDADKFKDDISVLIANFNSMFLSDIHSLISNPNGDRKESMKGFISLDIAKIQRDLHEVIYKVEDKLKSNALILLAEHNYSELEAQSYLARYFFSGFIKSNIINELNSTLSLLQELTVLAVSHLNVLETNSGSSGFFRGLFKGYTNPVDGVSHVFGQGSMQIEVNSSVQGFNSASALVGQSIDAVSNSLHNVILEKWNNFGAMLEKTRINDSHL
ncbi:hypothetical protein [Catenovulum adriaticum]|uniref:Uncharacterized protein n=1 Tax=Catenovulum adriaticum TaxID=2984846 RepID=A0ABY7AHR0_9ALTE|nr:hypothetical protein [Catenovulum sp. TS8]WAJ68994.1 hypothetical protein OLW01_07265 [Catenovulum sp. TS8]